MSKYYYDTSLNKLLSYNRPLNFIEGIRGRGKTYAFKKWRIKKFIEDGAKTCWIRYNRDHQRKALEDFSKKISKEFPENIFKIKGKSLLIDGVQAIQFFSLTVDGKVTSIEIEDDYDCLVFDEYLTEFMDINDYALWLNLQETLIRDRTWWKQFFLSNNITKNNPHHRALKIKEHQINGKSEWVKGKDFVIHLDKQEASETFREEKKKSLIGKLQMANGYGKFSIDGEWKLDDDTNITFANNSPKRIILQIDGIYLWEIWNSKEWVIWASDEIKGNTGTKFTLGQIQKDMPNIKDFPKVKKLIKNAILEGCMYYHNIHTAQYIKEIF